MNQKIMFSDEQVALLQAAGYLGEDGVFFELEGGVFEMFDMNNVPNIENIGVQGGCSKCNRIFALEMVMDIPHATLTERLSDAEKLMKWLEGGDS